MCVSLSLCVCVCGGGGGGGVQTFGLIVREGGRVGETFRVTTTPKWGRVRPFVAIAQEFIYGESNCIIGFSFD